MGKTKNSDKTAFQAPDYESLTTIEECDEFLVKHKDRLVGKDITEANIKSDKKDYNAAINEQLKEIKEEREHEMGVISALNDRKRVINGAKITQLRPNVAAKV
jgi:phage regulator Rha-like protein